MLQNLSLYLYKIQTPYHVTHDSILLTMIQPHLPSLCPPNLSQPYPPQDPSSCCPSCFILAPCLGDVLMFSSKFKCHHPDDKFLVLPINSTFISPSYLLLIAITPHYHLQQKLELQYLRNYLGYWSTWVESKILCCQCKSLPVPVFTLGNNTWWLNCLVHCHQRGRPRTSFKFWALIRPSPSWCEHLGNKLEYGFFLL